jgi:sugar/nucleoside kinase (ribokinase family)
MKRTIIAAGTLAFDTLETPTGKKEKILGGTANHFSIAASLFTNVEVSAIVGADYPLDYLKTLNKRGIGTSNVEVATGKTFHWCARYTGAMNEAETLNTHLNVLVDYNPVMNDIAKKCEVLFLASLTPSKQLKAISEAKGAKLIIGDTMNFWIENSLDELKQVISKIDIFILNEHEARSLTDEINIIRALKKIVTMGPSTVIIKRGEYGAFVYREGEKLFYVPAYPLEQVVDPTGAGDTFAGGFVGYLATSPDYSDFKEIKKAMLYGTIVASFIVEGFGSEGTIGITMDDVKKRYNELVSMIKID